MSRARLPTDSLSRLLEAPSYRAFARTWIGERARSGRFGYADVARAGGFKSRAFVRDVTLGAKRLTLGSLDKFSRGLGLTGELAEYFRLLVLIEEPDCRAPRYPLVRLERARAACRRRLLAKHGVAGVVVPSHQIFDDELVRVYAALGAPDVGASAAEISARTRIPAAPLSAALERILRLGVATRRGDRYVASESLLSLEALHRSAPFRKRYARSCLRAIDEAETQMDSPHKLFLSAAISVRSVDLERCKDELRAALTRFVESAERAEGDRVVELVAAFF